MLLLRLRLLRLAGSFLVVDLESSLPRDLDRERERRTLGLGLREDSELPLWLLTVLPNSSTFAWRRGFLVRRSRAMVDTEPTSATLRLKTAFCRSETNLSLSSLVFFDRFVLAIALRSMRMVSFTPPMVTPSSSWIACTFPTGILLPSMKVPV